MSEPTADLSPEHRMVLRRRYLEARRAGLTRAEARVFAHDTSIDVGLLRKLVELECPPDKIAEVLL